MARRWLHLASNRLFWEVGDPYAYPYAVDISVGENGTRVYVSEGVTHSAVGADLSLDEALSSTWAEHFVRAEATWLQLLLERTRSGQAVSESEYIARFVDLHGREPRIVESPYD